MMSMLSVGRAAISSRSWALGGSEERYFATVAALVLFSAGNIGGKEIAMKEVPMGAVSFKGQLLRSCGMPWIVILQAT